MSDDEGLFFELEVAGGVGDYNRVFVSLVLLKQMVSLVGAGCFCLLPNNNGSPPHRPTVNNHCCSKIIEP